jgi:hypothetical protein
MTAPHADQLIEGYLARLRAAADGFPADARIELVDDVSAHITEARSREPGETDATILNILDRLGDPAAVAAEARERLGLRTEPAYKPGLLEVAAVVLVPLFWPVGVILLWISPAWKTRDKIIGTLLPPGGYLGVLTVGLAAAGTHSVAYECPPRFDAAGNPVAFSCGPAGPSIWIQAGLWILTLAIYILPLVTAAYLGIRLRWGRRRQMAIAQEVWQA